MHHMIREKLLQYATLSEDQFWGFLDGQTRPAKFKQNDGIWVVRYLQKYPMNLRLASEFIGYRIAQKLGVPVPEFKVVRIGQSFKRNYFVNQKDEKIEIQAGFATACKWLEDAHYPDLRGEPLDNFWKEKHYLEIASRARTVDTWIMNFDRMRKGNVIFTGSPQAPQVWFLDFDQSFLANEKCQIHGDRLHWSEQAFRKEWLDDTELLSGFDGKGDVKCESIQLFDHFKDVLVKMESISEEELKEVLQEIPLEWDISEKARQQWLNSLLYRRDITFRNIKKRYPL